MPNRPWYLQGLANQLMPDVSGDTPPEFGATNPAPAVDWGDFTPQTPPRYDGWELTNRPAMLPFLGEYTNTATGEKSGGMAWPSMVTEPVQAAQRFIGDGGMWDVENPDNARDGNTLLWSLYGGNALNPMARVPKNALASGAMKAENPSIMGSAIAGAQAERPGIVAYHGSPHDFDRFSLDKIGTGEGAQAYGHGLYFAENEGVAKSYRDNVTRAHDHYSDVAMAQSNGPFDGSKRRLRSKAVQSVYGAS